MTQPDWSPYQEAIFTAVTTTKDSLIIEAVAGSGKTTTIVEAANRTKACRGLSLAFNKRIADELSTRLPRHFEAKTLNALGHRAWQNHVGSRLKVDTSKIFKICKDIRVPTEGYSDVMALVNSARNAGLVPNDEFDVYPTWEELADTYDLECTRDLVVYAREVLSVSVSQAKEGIIDFSDQLYMPTLFDARFETFDIVMVDEAQDLSSLQHDMLERVMHPKTRLIAVGDTRQAIYGFRGALNNSMTRLRDRFSLRELPLTISYRCPQAVVAEAQKVVSHIEASPLAEIGQVAKLSAPVSLSSFPPGSAVLCRNNAPLVSLAWKFIRSGISVSFLGRDLGKNLEKLVKRLARKPVDIDTLDHNLSRWLAREISKHPRREGALTDKADTLRAMYSGCSTSGDVLARIAQIFNQDSDGRVTLASIHKSKGFEWPTVFFLNQDLIPSQYTKLDWQFEQEDNLRYVAITRAQENLYYVDLEEIS